MRKTHCACLLFGLLLGMPLGVGLVVLHMKYSHGPIVHADTSPAALQETILEEPKPDGSTPLDDSSWFSGGSGSAEPAPGEGNLLAPIAVGPVEVTVVQRSHPKPTHDRAPSLVTPAGVADPAAQREHCERRMLQHLLQHARTSGQPAAAPTSATEESAPEEGTAPTGEPVQPDEVPELLPMPRLAVAECPTPPAVAETTVQTVPPEREVESPAHELARINKFIRAQGWRLPTGLPCVGAYACTLADDGDFKLPETVHEILGNRHSRTLYLVPVEDRILVYSSKGLKQCLQLLQDGGYLEAASSQARALWFGRIRRCEVSVMGEATFPVELARMCGLTGQVVLVGAGDHFEFWHPEKWREAMPAVPAVAEPHGMPPDEDGEVVREVRDD